MNCLNGRDTAFSKRKQYDSTPEMYFIRTSLPEAAHHFEWKTLKSIAV